MNKQTIISALEWHIDVGATEALSDEPFVPHLKPVIPELETVKSIEPQLSSNHVAEPLLGTAQAKDEALRLAKQAQNLSELESVVADFDGLSLKATATNIVFSDGNPEAPIMLIGEAPGADEDRQGKPFVGDSGQLLDKILASIGLDRESEVAENAVYISNILNWRPPGNRNPTEGEVQISLPFIEKHIALIKPKLLLLVGGMACNALLGSKQSISKSRGQFHDYVPQTEGLLPSAPEPIPALATYHPSYLLRTPAQKRLVWHDMLKFQSKREELKLL